MDNYEKLSSRIEDTFNKLEETINNVTLLRQTINNISTINSQLIEEIRLLKEDEKTKSLVKEQNKLTTTIRNDIAKITSNIVEVEAYRSYFQSEIAAFNQRLNGFSKNFEDKAKIANNTKEVLEKMVANINTQHNNLNSSRNRVLKVADEINLFNHYEEVKKEQAEQRKLLEQILSKLK